MSSDSEDDNLIVMDVTEVPIIGDTTHPEGNEGVRRFAVELGNALDKLKFIQTAFNGPDDPNYRKLASAIGSLDDDYETDSETDTSSET